MDNRRCGICHQCGGCCACDDIYFEDGKPACNHNALKMRFRRWRYRFDQWWYDLELVDWFWDHIPRLHLRRGGGRAWGISLDYNGYGRLFVSWYDLKGKRWILEISMFDRRGPIWSLSFPPIPSSPPEPPVEMHKVLEVRLSDGEQRYPAGSSITWDVENLVAFSPPIKVLGNPQMESNMESNLPTQAYIEKLGYERVTLIAAPVGAFDRLHKALEKAKKEGRGTTSLDDLGIQFFNAVDPAGPNTYAAIERTSTGNVIVSDYKLWVPQGVDDKAKELYDCYAVANEINALK